MDNEAKRIAEGLTEAGREAFDWVRPCSIIAPYRAGCREIEELGLVEMKPSDRHFIHITPLGLRVRTYLEQKQ